VQAGYSIEEKRRKTRAEKRRAGNGTSHRITTQHTTPHHITSHPHLSSPHLITQKKKSTVPNTVCIIYYNIKRIILYNNIVYHFSRKLQGASQPQSGGQFASPLSACSEWSTASVKLTLPGLLATVVRKRDSSALHCGLTLHTRPDIHISISFSLKTVARAALPPFSCSISEQ
jgi:hypothetical protein